MKFVRSLLAAAVSLTVLVGCQSSPEPNASTDGNKTSSTSSSSGSTSAAESNLTFTHPTLKEVKVTFDHKPTKLVMDYYSAAALSFYGVKPAAVFGYGKGDKEITENVDLQGIPVVGNEGEISLEKLAEIKPDAIIGHGSAKGWSWFKEDVNQKLTRVAPFIPMSMKGTVEENMKQVEDIAAFFGGTPDSPEVKKAHDDFTQAKDAVKKAAEGKNLSVLLASPTKETVYTAVGFPTSNMLEELGLKILGPEKPKQGNPWGKVAWEQLSNYPADIVMNEYSEPFTVVDNPLWQAQPAIKAKQNMVWASKMPYTPKAYAAWLNQLAELVSRSKKLS